MIKKRYSIDGPAGTMFEKTVPQDLHFLPTKLGGKQVSISKLTLSEAADLLNAGWECLIKKTSDDAALTASETKTNQSKPKK